jgi:hypothetical protein
VQAMVAMALEQDLLRAQHTGATPPCPAHLRERPVELYVRNNGERQTLASYNDFIGL